MKPCATCLAPTSKQCKQCKIAYYCSIECQTKDWKAVHFLECKSGCMLYDAMQACKDIVSRLVGDSGTRAQFSKLTRNQPGAHGVGMVYKNAHEIRLALTTGNVSVCSFYLMDASQYQDVADVAPTENTFVLLVQVLQPGETQKCASLALSVPHYTQTTADK